MIEVLERGLCLLAEEVVPAGNQATPPSRPSGTNFSKVTGRLQG